MKLSKTQINTLIRLKDHEAHYHRYMGWFNTSPYWSIEGYHVRCSTMDKLYNYGLILISKDILGYADSAILSAEGLEKVKDMER